MPEEVTLGNNETPASTSKTAPSANMNSGVGGIENAQLNFTSDSDTSETVTGKLTLSPGAERCSSSGVLASRHSLSFTSAGWFSPIESMLFSLMLNGSSPAEAYDLIQPLMGSVAELPAKLRAIADGLEAAQSTTASDRAT